MPKHIALFEHGFTSAGLLLAMVFQLSSFIYAQSSEDVRTLFQTLDDLAPTNVWKKPLVRLVFDGANPDDLYCEYGILLEQSDETVFTWNSRLQLLELPLRKRSNSRRVVNRVEVVTLEDQVSFFKKEKDLKSGFYPDIAAAFWARVAHANNEIALRDELLEIALLLPNLQSKTLAHLTNEIIPYEEYLRIVRSFEEISIPREKILEWLVRFARLFPNFDRSSEVIQLRDDVRSLVDEDAKHLVVDEKNLTTDEHVAELIYQLRNQEAGPLFGLNHHPARLKSDAKQFEEEPCWKLYRIGFAAVPQLIEAVSDTRPARIVEHPKITANTASTYRIGNCAELILWQFVDDNPVFDKESVLERQSAYRAWNEKVHEVGVKNYLIGIVERGAVSSEKQALLLARHYPEDASSSIKKGITNTTKFETRFKLREVLDTLKSKD